uniref:Uncharacterized protein n=1 Tax=Chrysemys picta bellii TaxID=8478 RepID=A0A8C3EZ84_CHRPI
MAGSLKPSPMSVHVVAFGNERDGFSEDNQQSSLIWTYLGRSALISETESSLLLNSANHIGSPMFTEYQACVFGNVRLVVHDCPLWNQSFNSEDLRITVTEQQWQLILLSPTSCFWECYHYNFCSNLSQLGQVRVFSGHVFTSNVKVLPCSCSTRGGRPLSQCYKKLTSTRGV